MLVIKHIIERIHEGGVSGFRGYAYGDRQARPILASGGKVSILFISHLISMLSLATHRGRRFFEALRQLCRFFI